jgi:hypothetical protein
MSLHTALRPSVRLSDSSTLPALADPDPLIGLAGEDRPVALPADAGHVLVATGAGGGTTTVLRSLAAQALARGAQVDFLDITRVGHVWAHGLPRARHFETIAEIHDYLVVASASLGDGAQPSAAGWSGRQVVVVEELGRVADELRRYWGRTRPETQLEEAPGVDALALLLSAGRVFGWQVLAGDAGGSIPGPGHLAPRVFSTRILGNGSQTLWQRVAPGVPAPEYSVIRGRVHFVTGNTATALQALYLTDDEARDLARSEVASGRQQQECA